jgi:hypothetical protein
MSDEKLVIEACMNCKNYILGLCLNLDHWVEDDDWCAAWERLDQTVESNADLDASPPAFLSPAEA